MALDSGAMRAVRTTMFTAAVLLGSRAAGAAPVSDVRVRGSAEITAQAQAKGSVTEVRGNVVDDLGHPVPDVGLRLEFEPTSEPVGAGLNIAGCPPTAPDVLLLNGRPPPQPSSYRIETSSAGQFCIQLSDSHAQGSLRLSLDDRQGLYERTERIVPVDRTKHALTLRFSPGPLDLESISHTVFVETRSAVEAAAEPITLVLALDATDVHRVLDKRVVTPGDRVQFDATTSALGDPGPATLTVKFAGSEVLLAAEQSARVLRTSRVDLEVDAGDPLDPDGGSSIVVHAHGVGRTPPTGAVEATLNGETLGIATLVTGSARVPLRGFVARSDRVALTLRYLPVDPWWIASPPLDVAVPVAPPSAWHQLPWLLGAALLGVWLFGAWRRPGRTEKPKRAQEAEATPGRPSVEILEPGAHGSGWQGQLHDAHDQSPIAGGRVAILVPAIDGDGVVEHAVTDAAGRFALRAVPDASTEGARLVVSARWHATLQRPLPSEGTLAIQLVTRRRALLDRLVDWATRQGRPWAAAGQPTPGHVARIAARRQSPEIAGWADAVEQAAYGPNPVEGALDDAIRRREPSAVPKRPDDRT